MDGTADRHARGRLPGVGSSPQIECPTCRMPILLGFVERAGDRRWIDCPYCGRHDEWRVSGGT